MWADKTEGQVQRRQGCTEEGVPKICDFGVPDIGNKKPYNGTARASAELKILAALRDRQRPLKNIYNVRGY